MSACLIASLDLMRCCVFVWFAANDCTPTEVANSNQASEGSITGSTGAEVSVQCDVGYSGGGLVTCGADGSFSSVTCSGTLSWLYVVLVCIASAGGHIGACTYVEPDFEGLLFRDHQAW